jgi:hypothetical protein
MWIAFNDGFISAVQDRKEKDGLVIRARRREHLERIFPKLEIFTGLGTDYKYRIFIKKTEFATLLAERAGEIDYTNFKSSVEDEDLHRLYNRFWRLHYEFQR